MCRVFVCDIIKFGEAFKACILKNATVLVAF